MWLTYLYFLLTFVCPTLLSLWFFLKTKYTHNFVNWNWITFDDLIMPWFARLKQTIARKKTFILKVWNTVIGIQFELSRYLPITLFELLFSMLQLQWAGWLHLSLLFCVCYNFPNDPLASVNRLFEKQNVRNYLSDLFNNLSLLMLSTKPRRRPYYQELVAFLDKIWSKLFDYWNLLFYVFILVFLRSQFVT